jgi:hypothetical protein
MNINPNNYYTLKGTTLADVGVKTLIAIFEDDESQEGVKIQYKEYCMLDLEALTFLEKHFNFSDIGKITLLPTMLKSSARNKAGNNILWKTQRTPHNITSLGIRFQMSRSKFSAFFNKLFKANIVAKGISYINEKKVTVIFLNPYLTKRHINSDSEMLTLFKKLG